MIRSSTLLRCRDCGINPHRSPPLAARPHQKPKWRYREQVDDDHLPVTTVTVFLGSTTSAPRPRPRDMTPVMTLPPSTHSHQAVPHVEIIITTAGALPAAQAGLTGLVARKKKFQAFHIKLQTFYALKMKICFLRSF